MHNLNPFLNRGGKEYCKWLYEQRDASLLYFHSKVHADVRTSSKLNTLVFTLNLDLRLCLKW